MTSTAADGGHGLAVATVARLLAKVNTSGGHEACWPWVGYIGVYGYGRFNVWAHGRPHDAHRLVYETLVGEVPAGLVLDHVCHTLDPTCVGGNPCAHRRCCNPLHLEPVTEDENKARAGQRLTTCKHGHPLIEANRYYRRDRPGKFDCLTCRRKRDRGIDPRKPERTSA